MVCNNLVVSVVKDVPIQWFVVSLPSSVGCICCVKDYVTGVYYKYVV